MRERARLAGFPHGFAARPEADSGFRLAPRKIDRAQHGAVHAEERLVMRAGVEDRDVDRNANALGLVLGRREHSLGLARSDHGHTSPQMIPPLARSTWPFTHAPSGPA